MLLRGKGAGLWSVKWALRCQAFLHLKLFRVLTHCVRLGPTLWNPQGKWILSCAGAVFAARLKPVGKSKTVSKEIKIRMSLKHPAYLLLAFSTATVAGFLLPGDSALGSVQQQFGSATAPTSRGPNRSRSSRAASTLPNAAPANAVRHIRSVISSPTTVTSTARSTIAGFT